MHTFMICSSAFQSMLPTKQFCSNSLSTPSALFGPRGKVTRKRANWRSDFWTLSVGTSPRPIFGWVVVELEASPLFPAPRVETWSSDGLLSASLTRRIPAIIVSLRWNQLMLSRFFVIAANSFHFRWSCSSACCKKMEKTLNYKVKLKRKKRMRKILLLQLILIREELETTSRPISDDYVHSLINQVRVRM